MHVISPALLLLSPPIFMYPPLRTLYQRLAVGGRRAGRCMAPKALLLVGVFLLCALVAINGEELPRFRLVLRKESRRTLVLTESGQITAVDVHDGCRGAYHLQFITLEPGSLFLPVLLHTDMVFYVQTGRGTVTYMSEDKDNGTDEMDVVRGDVYRLEQGTTFYVQSYPDPTREKLRLLAIFDTTDIDNPLGSSVGAYSNISDLVRGFDEKVLQMGFGVSEETIRGIKWVPAPPSIVPSTKKETDEPNWKEGIFEALLNIGGPTDVLNKKKSKTKTFNFFRAKPDVQNCNGWSTALTHKNLKALKGSNLAPFMVNLTRGSMMGPHWNPRASEIAIVIHGEGMVQVVCPSDPSGKVDDVFKCQNMKFKVKEGDVFVVPRFRPMTQISFNSDTFVFVGFSSMAGHNHPQFLAGKRSVLHMIDRDVLAVSLKAANASAIEELLASQGESIILACTSCAEELERKMEEEEIERQKEEEERKRAEEEAKKREEEARKKAEEEAKKREEEEARRREEEEARRREAARRREEEEEEEAKRREEARRREEEEEEARGREEEEAKRREEEEEARGREEEEAKRREEEEEARGREEEEAKRREEEEERRREKEERKEEEEARRKEEEEAGRREEKRREEEEEEEEEEEAKRRSEEGGEEEARWWVEAGEETPWRRERSFVEENVGV